MSDFDFVIRLKEKITEKDIKTFTQAFVSNGFEYHVFP